MKTKLTLSVDKELIHFARSQARQEKRSISGLFSDFLTARRSYTISKPSPSVDDMVGILKDHNIDDSKAGIRRAYAEKHLR